MPTSGYYRPIITEEDAVKALPRVIPRTKATPIPAPGIFDEPTYCLKINKSWMAHLSGVVAALDQPDTWIGTEDEIFATRNMIREWLIAIYNGSMCQPGTSCHDVQTSSSQIAFFPQDPYTQPDYVPPGYASTPFDVIQNEDYALVGLHTGDVVMFFDSAPNIESILDTGLPSITVHVEGKVEVELHLLKVPQGGLGFVTIDDDPLKTTIITLQSMSVSQLSTLIDILESILGDFPAVELFAEDVMEFKFDTDGPHKIEVRLMPFVSIADDAIVNVGIGGGIRKVTVCTMSDPEECCDEMSTKQDKTNLLLEELISLFEDGFKIVPIGGKSHPPDEAGGDCAPDHFDHNGDDEDETELLQREKALCLTIERYVKAVLTKVLVDMNAPQFVIDFVATKFPQTVPPTLANLTLVYPTAFDGLNVFFDAVTGNIDLTQLACAMIDGLTGDKNNTFVNFRDSLSGVVLDGVLDALIRIVNATNGVKENYKAFNTALNAANNEDLDTYECPCDETPPSECDGDLVIVDNLRPSTIITDMGDNIYRIQNSEQQIDDLYYADIDTDTAGQSIDILVPVDTITYPVQATANYQIYETDDSTLRSSGTGGFAPVLAVGRVTFASGDPIDTYYKVICHVDEP